MGKFRTGIWIVILVLLMLLFFQNQSIFLSSRTLQMDLYFVKYQTPELPAGLFYLVTLIIGLLISYLFAMGDRFKARRAVKSLSSNIDSHRQEVATLKKEIEELKRTPPPGPPPVIELPPAPDDALPSDTETGQPAEDSAQFPADTSEQAEPDKTDETASENDTDSKKGDTN